nr:hypothetical protein [Tanacetum cinerariifolium]
MIRKQVGDLSTHTTKYTSSALTQKVFANMRRIGKGFFGIETPLFEGMIVEKHVAEGDDGDEVHDGGVHAVGNAAERDVSAANDEISTSNEEPNRVIDSPFREVVDDVKDDDAQDQERKAESQAEIYKIDLEHAQKTEAQARKNMMIYLKNVAGFRMDYFKGMSYDDICPIFEAKFNTNVAFLLKIKEHIKEKESRAMKRLNETPAEKAAKRQKLDEEVEELKRHL